MPPDTGHGCGHQNSFSMSLLLQVRSSQFKVESARLCHTLAALLKGRSGVKHTDSGDRLGGFKSRLSHLSV